MRRCVKQPQLMKKPHTRENHTKQKDFYHTIAEASFAGIYMVQDGRFSYLNRNAASFAGYTPVELMGRDAFSIVHHEDRDLVDKMAREMLKGLRTEPYEFRIITKDLQTRWIMETVISITYQGKPAILGNSMDVTEKKQTEEALSLSENRYRTLIETTHDLVFTVDRQGYFTYINPQFQKTLGYTTTDLLDKPFTTIVAPDFLKTVLENFKTGIKGGIVSPYEVELLHKNGKRLLVEFLTTTIWDGQKGKGIGRFGIGRDITDRKLAQDDLKASEERYRTIIENIGDGYYEVDLKGTIQFINDACASISGVPRHKLTGMSFKDFAFEEDLVDLYNIFYRVFMTGKPEKGLVNRVKRPDGKELYVEISVSLKRDSKGKSTGFMGIIHDVTERKKAEETIQWMAYHDALTGLPNRILFHDRLVLALTQAKRNSEQLAVMMLDLDKFKEINDSYGHYMGDCILCAFVERIKKQLREGDTVARTGGDEFMTLLPVIRKVRDVEKLGEKIIAAFQKPVEVGEQSFLISVSIGIALYPRDGEDFDTMVKKADMAMYQAKKLGGNKYII